MTKVARPSMRRYGHADGLASGGTAANVLRTAILVFVPAISLLLPRLK